MARTALMIRDGSAGTDQSARTSTERDLIATRAVAVLAGTSLAVTAAAPAFAAEATGTVLHAASTTAVADSYLVVLKDGAQVDRSRADRLAGRYGGAVTRVFGHAVEGFTARLSARQAARLAADPSVATVEADQSVRIADTQTSAPWGLDRIDQRNLPLSQTYTYGPSSGVTVYVVDTGIRITHQQFGGRASYGYDAVDNDNVAQDGNGHGTFVAGVTAGSTYGVAKSANVVGVRVLDNNGSGTTAGVVAGIDWVTAHATPGRSVANLSLGGAWRTSDTATYTGSGTSFSAPHVAGAAALYLSAHPGSSVSAVNNAIVSAATTGVVGNPGSGSPNRLLYTATLGG